MSFGDKALAAMSGIFGISEAKAKEPEYSQNNLLENSKNIKKIPPVPAKKPEYNPNNLLENSKKISALSKAKQAGIYKENAKFDRLVDSVFGEEGDFEDDLNKIDQPTNMGIIQGTLNNFNKAHPELKINKSLKDITRDDAKLIYKLDFYDAYRIDEIDSPVLRLTIFDTLVNHSPHDPIVWIQEALNNKIGLEVKKDGILGSETINALNSLRSEYEVKNVNNYILEKRREDLENNKEKNIRPNYEQYTKGIPGRIDRLIVK